MTGPFPVNDIVGVDHKGRQFLAVVEGEDGRDLLIKPVSKNVTYFRVPKAEVHTHWRMRKGKTPVFRGNGGIVYG